MEEIKIEEYTFKSSNKRNTIKGKTYNVPALFSGSTIFRQRINIKGIIVILHGMSECQEIYDKFAKFLASLNFGVVTYDQLGHGESILTKDEQGFFGNEQGNQFLIEDVAQVMKRLKKYAIPIFLFGHSMGSLVARVYASKIVKKQISGLILCGTIGPQWAIDGAIQFAQYLIDQKGPRYRSRKLNELVIMVSNFKFGEMEYKLEWATKDKEYIKKVKEDERMNFVFTAKGFKDVFLLEKLANQKECAENTPKDLPILLISGKDDVLGEYGEGPKRVEQMYKKAGVKDVSLILYENARHNLMQDIEHKLAFKDVANWMEAVILAEKE